MTRTLRWLTRVQQIVMAATVITRTLRWLTRVQQIVMAATVIGSVASVALMIDEGAPVFCREAGALYLVSVALFTAVAILNFMRITYMSRTIDSQDRTIGSQKRVIEAQERMMISSDETLEMLVQRLTDKSPGKDQTQ